MSDHIEPDDLDRLLADSLRGAVVDVEAGDELHDRITTTLGANGRGRRTTRRAAMWTVGVAAAVLVGALAWSSLTGADDAGVTTDRPAPGPTTTTPSAIESTTSTSAVTTTTTTIDSGEGAPLPDRAVVARIRPDGSMAELVLVDLDAGSVIATLDSVDNRACDVSACHVGYAATAVTATYDLFVDRCCEPAGGNVMRYPDLDPFTGTVGNGEPFLGGYAPAVHPGGRRVATAGQVSIEIRDLVDGSQHSIDLRGPGGEAVFPTGLVWSPDGTELAVSLESSQGFSLVVVPAAADAVTEGTTVATFPDRRAVEAWTVDGRLWFLHSDDGSSAFPISTLDPETGQTTSYEVLARQLTTDRSGRYLYIVATDGLHRADWSASTADELLGSLLYPAGDDLLGAVSVVSSIECAVDGDTLVTVPNVIGSPLGDASAMLRDTRLRVIGSGVPTGDPDGPDAVVTAQKPSAGERVPVGACVAFRTR